MSMLWLSNKFCLELRIQNSNRSMVCYLVLIIHEILRQLWGSKQTSKGWVGCEVCLYVTGSLPIRALTGISSVTAYSTIVMTSRLRALGGRINNIRTSELPKEKTRSEVVCSVRFLDGLVQTFKVNVSSPDLIFSAFMPLGSNSPLLIF